jgi:hypothetical protein
MKTLKLTQALCLLITFSVMSCAENNDSGLDTTFLEVNLNSDNPTILTSINDIEFKFCLENEQGEAVNIFEEGENFYFYFSVTNKRSEKVFFDPDFAYSDGVDFCRIFSSNNQDLGKPFELLTVTTIGTAAYPFETGETRFFKQLWSDDRDSVWYWQHAAYKSTHKETLNKGEYYTTFKYSFQFFRTNDESPLVTDTLVFKINFKIN